MGTRSEAAMDVAAAVFRYQFKQHANRAVQVDYAYFITLFRADPPPDFLRHFFMHSPPVRPGSAFRPNVGLKFSVDTVSFTDANAAEARGGYDDGLSSASDSIYRVIRVDGNWVVADDHVRWKS
jgi:hypothetical protein